MLKFVQLMRIDLIETRNIYSFPPLLIYRGHRAIWSAMMRSDSVHYYMVEFHFLGLEWVYFGLGLIDKSNMVCLYGVS